MRISVVTPVRNGAQFIAQTIESVLSQAGDFEIEYIVIDGDSTDGTADIVRQYAGALSDGTAKFHCRGVSLNFVSEPDHGMYDGLNNGLAQCTGDVCCWINADDFYLPGAFQAVNDVFLAFAEVDWIKGITNYVDEDGRPTGSGRCLCYDQDWIRQGVYGREAYFIQQDSVFWRRSLQTAAGPLMTTLKLAGDFHLWMTFARFAPLVSVNAAVSCFRQRPGQLSADSDRYAAEVSELVGRPYRRCLRVVLALLQRLPAPISTRCYRALFPNHRLRMIVLDSTGEWALAPDADFVADLPWSARQVSEASY